MKWHRYFWIMLLLCGLGVQSKAEALKTGQPCSIATQQTNLDRGVIHYKQAGTGQSVLLLHGLFAQKEQWDQWLCQLSAAGYRAIAPDLPGYGQSTGFPTTDYALESQVELLNQFTHSLEMKSFHIAGNSMGGAIAALYARKHPAEIRTLAFIGSPLGIVEWGSRVKKALYQGTNPFIPTRPNELDLEMSLLFAKPPTLPADVQGLLIKEYTERNQHFQQVWNIVNLYGNTLKKPAPSNPPTLILWGKNDAIFDSSDAHQALRPYPRAKLIQLPETGHLPHLENPAASGRIYLDFLGKKQVAPHRKTAPAKQSLQ